jgi:spermidine/putrescine transport system ATP-binding protein
MARNVVEIRGITKSFDSKTVVNDVSLCIGEGEFLTLLGPSGCGKTTILRMIGGFTPPDSGEILLHGKSVLGTPANRREVSTVFQGYALFPHLTVRGNVAFGLRMKKVPRAEIDERVSEILELTDLTLYQNRKPSQLSGGQQQRVAIARSLVTKPRIMLFDEPLGALDLRLRRQMQVELKKMQRSLGITCLYVTHDQEEALTMSDRIAVMNRGVVEQEGRPEEVYLYPKTRFVAAFLGESNLFEGRYIESASGASFETEGVSIPLPERGGAEQEPCFISIRPEFLNIGVKRADPCIAGVIERKLFQGQAFRYDVKLPSGRPVQVLSESSVFDTNAEVFLSWDKDKIAAI